MSSTNTSPQSLSPSPAAHAEAETHPSDTSRERPAECEQHQQSRDGDGDCAKEDLSNALHYSSLDPVLRETQCPREATPSRLEEEVEADPGEGGGCILVEFEGNGAQGRVSIKYVVDEGCTIKVTVPGRRAQVWHVKPNRHADASSPTASESPLPIMFRVGSNLGPPPTTPTEEGASSLEEPEETMAVTASNE